LHVIELKSDLFMRVLCRSSCLLSTDARLLLG
jgi:hypothetical protein